MKLAGQSRKGMARIGKAGSALRGKAGPGMDWFGRQGASGVADR